MNDGQRSGEVRSKFAAKEPVALVFIWIGPVQEFIQEARKLHDLMIGSRILARASYEVMQSFLTCKDDCTILLPSTEMLTDTSFAHLPNHCIALVRESRLESIVWKVEKSLNGFLPKLARRMRMDASLSDVFKSVEEADSTRRWKTQMKSHLQVSWVALTATRQELEADYLKHFGRLQQLMEERKLTRTFSPWKGARVDKCDQCGHREILGPNCCDKSTSFWKSLRGASSLRYKLKDREKLCGICFLKRIARESHLVGASVQTSFDSTSDVASNHFRETLRTKARLEPVNLFLTRTKHLAKSVGLQTETMTNEQWVRRIPGDWLYEEGLRFERASRDYSISADDECGLDEARRALLDVYGIVGKPCKYYAAVAFDADNMGRYLSGQGASLSGLPPMDWQHCQSVTLSNLAVAFGKIEHWRGQTIYSGGDDCLAVGPLEGALTAIEKARERFIDDFGNNMTISAAVVFAHHHDHLQRTLTTLRRSLQQAKEQYGSSKNALVVTVRISSGKPLTCGYKWNLEPRANGQNKLFATDLLCRLVAWMRNRDAGLSSAFLYHLSREADAFYRHTVRGLVHMDQEATEMLSIELAKLLRRHAPHRGALDAAEMTMLQDLLTFAAYPRIEGTAGSLSFNAQDNFNSLLAIAGFLAKQEVVGL